MSDDLHFIPGSFYRICERTGFKIRAGRTRPEWTQHIVRVESWEARQPQDFVRGVPDDQTVPDARPRQANVGIGPLTTTLSANAPAGATSLVLSTIAGIYAADTILLILDNKDTMYGLVVSVTPSTFTILLAKPLPYSASAGNELTDITSYVNNLQGYVLTDDAGNILIGGPNGPQLVSP